MIDEKKLETCPCKGCGKPTLATREFCLNCERKVKDRRKWEDGLARE